MDGNQFNLPDNLPEHVGIEVRSYSYLQNLRVVFPNGYAASVSRGAATYGGDRGLFEVAVVNEDNELDYSTPVTDDVVGWCDDAKVAQLMRQISELPRR